MKINEVLFFELIQVAIGYRTCLSYVPSDVEWQSLFLMAEKHSLVGVCFGAVEKLPTNQYPPKRLLLNWLAQAEYIKKRNKLVDIRCVELQTKLLANGFRSCVLKGQGNAKLYPKHLRQLRQSGDIDLWVEGVRDDIVNFLNVSGMNAHDIHIVHADAECFDDVVVEIHFQPSWMYNPWTDRKLQRFFREQSYAQFQLIGEKTGFTYPSVYFNLVYNLVHINRHIFDEGIGLRQVVDYYYILKASDKIHRKDAIQKLRELSLVKFTSALMYVMQEVFSMNDDLLLCTPNEKLGKCLLTDIVAGGNFGKYGKYARTTTNAQRIKRGFDSFMRNWQFISIYPEEVLWIPFFKIGHWCWRKKNGYL